MSWTPFGRSRGQVLSRNSPQPRFEPRRRNGAAPRPLLLGVGLFVITLLVLGALLIAGGGNDTSGGNNAGATPTATRPASPAAMLGVVTRTPTSAPRETATGFPTQQARVAAPTDTTAADVPTETAVTTPTASEAAPTAEDAGPTATAAEAPTGTPTAEPTPTSEPPAVGEFGELPPVEIPSGGLTRSLRLQYQLGVSLDTAPTEGAVYQLVWKTWSAAEVAALGSNLGIQGKAADLGGGSFRLEGTGGSVFISPAATQVVRSTAPVTSALEDDATLIANARAWLLNNGLVSADIGAGAVQSRDEAAARASVYFKAAEPTPLLAAYPSARVTIGPAGEVLEAYIKWPGGYQAATYQLRAPDALWNAAQTGQAFIEADLSGVPGSGPLTGTLTVTSISLAYSVASGATGDYLVPVIVFSGEARLTESDASVPVSIYVPAVAGQAAARG